MPGMPGMPGIAKSLREDQGKVISGLLCTLTKIAWSSCVLLY
jgi:hypothetical protein